MKKELNLQSKSLTNNNTQSHMKRKLLCLIAAMVLGGTMWAQRYTPHYSFNYHDYPANMTVVAQIRISGTIQQESSIEVGAFVGNQVRGSKFLEYYQEHGKWLAYIQVYGSPGEIVSYRFYNHTSGTEYVYCTSGNNSKTWQEGGYGTGTNPHNLSFTPISSYTFNGSDTNHNWSTTTNWVDSNKPSTNDVAIIINGICELDEDVTVASLTVNQNKSITIPSERCLQVDYAINTSEPSQLVIKEGGALRGKTGYAKATVEKEINGYTQSQGRDNYYFIASPLVSNTDRASVTNLTSNSYDLYSFDQSQDLEWINFKSDANLKLNPAEGYLYANNENVTLGFAGLLSNDITSKDLVYEWDKDFSGFNLIGNPSTYNVNIDKSYYIIDNGLITPCTQSSSTPITPCTGVMVQAEDEGETVTFTPASSAKSNNGGLYISLNDASLRGFTTDKAIVSFNEGDALNKFYFNDNAHIYIPQSGKDYAIISTEPQGEIPVNFKANHNGRYTLNIGAENTEMRYLHLIDNMTGKEVDLLDNPNYSFEAKTTDYDSRFKLVFATGQASDDSFAFYSNGNWIINNEGKATLQIIDVAGRMMSNETIEGCHSLNLKAVPGVYMFRLIKGNDVKVQKIIIK